MRGKVAAIPGTAWVQRGPEILTRDVGDEVLLTSEARSEVDVLKGTAAEVWRLLEEPIVVADLVGLLAEAYSADPAVVEADVDALLARLSEIGAVQVLADADD
jgi:Coenzyme PQQ synthesis protein D (PqqD)